MKSTGTALYTQIHQIMIAKSGLRLCFVNKVILFRRLRHIAVRHIIRETLIAGFSSKANNAGIALISHKLHYI